MCDFQRIMGSKQFTIELVVHWNWAQNESDVCVKCKRNQINKSNNGSDLVTSLWLRLETRDWMTHRTDIISFECDLWLTGDNVFWRLRLSSKQIKNFHEFHWNSILCVCVVSPLLIAYQIVPKVILCFGDNRCKHVFIV